MQVASSISHAKQLLDTVFYKNAEKFVAKSGDIDRVVDLLCDQRSKRQFLDEISYLVLASINGSVAALHASPMNPDRWKDVAAKWDDFEKSDAFPSMDAPEGERQFLKNMIITTFLAEQYSYGDVTVRKGDVVLDCGACFGDSALWAYGRGAEQVHSFEPSPLNHAWLVRNIRSSGHDESLCRQLAVGAEDAEISFVAAPGVAGSSRVSDKGNIVTKCVRLDDYCKEHGIRPDYIKMDIEGCEVSALQGCRETIATCRPRLAVCLYHKPSDMWEVPLLVHELCPEYRLYCRKNNVANEFVLYATAEDASA